MSRLVSAGFTSFDGADHYGSAELLMGELRKWYLAENGADKGHELQLFTKWVPPAEDTPFTRVQSAVDRSLQRMGVKCIDILQFHWWDYEHEGYLEAMYHLKLLQSEGKIKHLALTNFDTEHMKRIIDNGVSIVSNQRNIKLLAYGTLLGGLLSKKWIGKPEPVGKPQLSTASLIKYKRFVDKWGSWELFQELLQTLNGVAEKHNVGIANVAIKFILDKPAVGAVIVGIRPGYSDHIEDNIKSFSLSLNANDIQLIEAVIAKGNRLAGEPGDEYRYQ